MTFEGIFYSPIKKDNFYKSNQMLWFLKIKHTVSKIMPSSVSH